VERTRSHSMRDLLLEIEVEGRAERTMEAGSTQRRFGRTAAPCGLTNKTLGKSRRGMSSARTAYPTSVWERSTPYLN
jgi:hypothetical protein